jgi:acetyl esterase
MIAAMAPMGMDVHAPALPFDHTAPLETLHEYIAMSEAGFDALGDVLVGALPPVSGVTSSVEVARGVDNNDITLFIHRPVDATGPLPAVLHLHGGGMVFMEAAGPSYRRWREELAATGMIVIGVEFRNGGGKHGPHPFPAGLNDCSSALQWVAKNKVRLGISKLIISGESGGGNLTLATTLQAKQGGYLPSIDGVYAQCPYISGVYASKAPELPSLYENDGYFLDCQQMAVFVRIYDPSGENSLNPLAWPYHASVDDLRGLPPHLISVNQLDPLRDEGLAYFRKLLDAGVRATSRTVNGTCHAGDCLFLSAMPDVYYGTIRDIKGFADSL